MIASALSWERHKLLANRSRYELRKALDAGEVVKPDRCARCGRRAAVLAHHPIYSEPLLVQWLCPSCHAAVHRELRIRAAGGTVHDKVTKNDTR